MEKRKEFGKAVGSSTNHSLHIEAHQVLGAPKTLSTMAARARAEAEAEAGTKKKKGEEK